MTVAAKPRSGGKGSARTQPMLDSSIDAVQFRRRLMDWYRASARQLPWRGTADPYRIWISEVMLQQTRVASVTERYTSFLQRFPTVIALALAEEGEVLAAWSGLGYYQRARRLHRAARFVVQELGGILPPSCAGLRSLPGIGSYTCAAIASIAYGESVAAVDGNVERVLLRLTGHSELSTAAVRGSLATQANALMPRARVADGRNAAGDHNQAMMELGATICLPRGPLCAVCPVVSMCKTRGEHATLPRKALRSQGAAYLLSLRKRGTRTEVLLARRPDEATLMAGMYELPPLDEGAIEGREPLLRARHAITHTNYYVQVFTPRDRRDRALRSGVTAEKESLEWINTSTLGLMPLTGMARKALQRLNVMAVPGLLPRMPVEDELELELVETV